MLKRLSSGQTDKTIITIAVSGIVSSYHLADIKILANLCICIGFDKFTFFRGIAEYKPGKNGKPSTTVFSANSKALRLSQYVGYEAEKNLNFLASYGDTCIITDDLITSILTTLDVVNGVYNTLKSSGVYNTIRLECLPDFTTGVKTFEGCEKARKEFRKFFKAQKAEFSVTGKVQVYFDLETVKKLSLDCISEDRKNLSTYIVADVGVCVDNLQKWISYKLDGIVKNVDDEKNPKNSSGADTPLIFQGVFSLHTFTP